MRTNVERCPQGHEINGPNFYVNNASARRRCRICQLVNAHIQYSKKKGETITRAEALIKILNKHPELNLYM